MLLLDVPKIEPFDTTANVNDQNLRHQHLKCLVGKQILFDMLKKIHIHVAESLLQQDMSCASKQNIVGWDKIRSCDGKTNIVWWGNVQTSRSSTLPYWTGATSPFGWSCRNRSLLGQVLRLKTNIVCFSFIHHSWCDAWGLITACRCLASATKKLSCAIKT